MSEAKGLPLKIIHYKAADYGGEGYDTGVRVTEEDLNEAAARIRGSDVPTDIHPHLIADYIIKKFRDRIKATVEAQPETEVREYDPNNWRIQDGELGDAIRRVAGCQPEQNFVQKPE